MVHGRESVGGQSAGKGIAGAVLPTPAAGVRSRGTAGRSLVRRPAVAALIAATLLLALGCGGGGDDTVVVTFWQFWPTETIRPLIESFEAEHPGIRVEMQQLTWQSGLEKITASVAAGRPPDLCELGSTWFAKFAANGALADLTETASGLRSEFLMWEACTYEDAVYGLPWVMGTRALFVNRDLVRAAGFDPDRPPETWEDLLALAGAVHDPQRRVYGYGMNSGERYVQFKKFMPFAWGNGGRVLSADGRRCTFAEPPVLQALQYYLRLRPVSLLEKQEILDQAFREGRLGAMISGAWLLKTLPRDAPELDFGVGLVPRPRPGEGTHASFGGGEILVVFRRSPRQEAALKLARYLIEPPRAMAVARAEQSVLPAAAGAADDPYFTENPMQAVFREQLETAVFPPNVEGWVEIQDVVDSWLERAVFEKAAPADALREACKEIEALLARSAP